MVWNDRVDFAAIEAMTITHIVISPGPGGPSEAGASEDVIRQIAGRVPILFVCLGHQAIFEVYGGHSRSVWGDHAWEDLCHPPRCTRCLPRDSRPVSSCSIPLSCRNCRHTPVVSDRHSEDVEWTDHGCMSQVVSCRGGSSFILRASSPSTATSSCTTLLSTTAS